MSNILHIDRGPGSIPCGADNRFRAIFDAVNDPSDRLRYRVAGGLLAMRAVLPDPLWRWMLSMGMKRPARGGQGAPQASRKAEVTSRINQN